MLDLFIETIFNLGYIGFFIYMILVGTFIPLPTQLILLPAGFLIAQGKLDTATTILVTALGTTTGATINYFLADYIAQKFISKDKVAKVKKFFNKYGKLSVALAPLSFGMGQYISIPAGMAKMELKWFLPIIFLSNMLWNSAMVMIGYTFGAEANREVSYLITLTTLTIVFIISYFVYKEFKSY